MHYPDFQTFLATGAATFAKGPVGIILVEDKIEVESTIRHHLDAGFKALAVFGAAEFDLATLATEKVAVIDHNVLGDQGPATVVKPGFHRAAALDRIHKALAEAPHFDNAKLAEDDLWLTWMMAPDEQTAEELNQAIRAKGGYNFEKAIGFLDTMIARHPDYPESWNQRSYVHFLMGNFDKSLSDCEHALTLEPRHIGCLAGMAMILIRHQKRYKAGKALLDRAIALYPLIHEKVLLKEIPEGAL